MRRAGLLLVMVLPACFTIPDYAGPVGPDAADEDGDGIPNSHDLCPHLNNGGGAQADTDGDAVGNACDPNEGMEDIAYFFSFDALDIGDLLPMGSVQPRDSYLELGATGSEAINSVFSPQSFSRVHVELRYRIDSTVDSPTDGLRVAMGTYDDAGTVRQAACLLDVQPGGGSELTAAYNAPGMLHSESSGGPDLTFVGLVGRLQGTLANTQVGCLSDQLPMEHDPLAIGVTLPAPAPPGRVGVIAINTRVTLEFLYIVGVP